MNKMQNSDGLIWQRLQQSRSSVVISQFRGAITGLNVSTFLKCVIDERT